MKKKRKWRQREKGELFESESHQGTERKHTKPRLHQERERGRTKITQTGRRGRKRREKRSKLLS